MFALCTFLHVADPPRVISHPQELKDVVPSKSVMFATEATGTEPLRYEWEWKPVMGGGKWQSCYVERFPGADSSTLTIPSVQKFNEGHYRCVVSNCVGSQTTSPAKLRVGKSRQYYSYTYLNKKKQYTMFTFLYISTRS